jgi:hypothetical protein
MTPLPPLTPERRRLLTQVRSYATFREAMQARPLFPFWWKLWPFRCGDQWSGWYELRRIA